MILVCRGNVFLVSVCIFFLLRDTTVFISMPR